MSLPKTVWSFWHKGEKNAPEYIQKCLNTWRTINPNWDVRVLDLDSIFEFLDPQQLFGANIESISAAALSDLLRINLLAKYGGVWVDATCVCRKPLDVWLPLVLKSGFFAFDKPALNRPLASWFLAAEKGHHIPEVWSRFINQVWSCNIEVIEHSHKLQHVTGGNNTDWHSSEFWQSPRQLPYFWLHFSFAYLLKNSDTFAELWDKTPKITAAIPHFFTRGKYKSRDVSVLEY